MLVLLAKRLLQKAIVLAERLRRVRVRSLFAPSVLRKAASLLLALLLSPNPLPLTFGLPKPLLYRFLPLN